nr:MAG TPA: hypothetical protein [Caudoviricetes sp.]
MTSFIICEDSAYNDIILNMDNIAFIHPATRTVGLTSIHFDGNGVVELSEQGMNTLKYRIYSDIARSHDE